MNCEHINLALMETTYEGDIITNQYSCLECLADIVESFRRGEEFMEDLPNFLVKEL